MIKDQINTRFTLENRLNPFLGWQQTSGIQFCIEKSLFGCSFYLIYEGTQEGNQFRFFKWFHCLTWSSKGLGKAEMFITGIPTLQMRKPPEMWAVSAWVTMLIYRRTKTQSITQPFLSALFLLVQGYLYALTQVFLEGHALSFFTLWKWTESR